MAQGYFTFRCKYCFDSFQNKTPSDLTLTANKIREDAHSLSVGTLKTVDRDQPQGTNFKYEILEGFGSSDYDKFSINQETGELSLKNKPNYSNQKEYQVAIQVTDAGGKSITRFFKI